MFKSQLELNSVIRKIKNIVDSPSESLLAVNNNADNNTNDIVDVTSYLVGMVFGTHVPLPTSEQPLPKAWFATNYGKEVRKAINDINEGVMINIGEAYGAAADVFEMRYNVCYSKNFTLEQLFNLMSAVKQFDEGGPAFYNLGFAETEELQSLFKSLNIEINSKKITGEG